MRELGSLTERQDKIIRGPLGEERKEDSIVMEYLGRQADRTVRVRMVAISLRDR